MKTTRTSSLSSDIQNENTKTTVTVTQSICCTRIFINGEYKRSTYETPKKQSVIKFEEENASQPDNRPSHDTLATRPSLRSLFSLVANMSNRPSIFSKFREASGGLVFKMFYN